MVTFAVADAGTLRARALIGIFVVAAFLTPPDAVSQCFMAVPMWLLFEFGILLAQYLVKRRATDKAAHEATLPHD